MVVLLTGASGFIGSHIANRLCAAGHEVVVVVRDPLRLQLPPADDEADVSSARGILGDFTTDQREEAWLPRLVGIDAVVNAAGIFREQGDQTFEAIHRHGPVALFRACARAGVHRVIQLSALGADADAPTAFLRSKRLADDTLLSLPVAGLVLQPSLVFGADGESSRLFLRMATWPLLPLPGGGESGVQPVHVDDLAEAVVEAVERPEVTGRVAAVGPFCLPLRDYLASLRRGLGLGAARVIRIPHAAMRGLVRVPWLSGGWLDRDAVAMLARDNCDDGAPFAALLARQPRCPADFVRPAEARALATAAQLAWLLPVLRLTIALIWLLAGVVSLGVYPVSESLALLAAAGASGWFAWLLLYGAAAVDILFGVGTLLMRRRRWLWRAQLVVIAFYTLVITVALPEFWLHPYGPVVKNLPIMAAILLLMTLEEPA